MVSRAMRLVAGAVVVAAFTPLVMGSSGLREDELECEETMVHVEDCCPTFHLNVGCTYSDGCGHQEPDLRVNQSECIRKLDCDQIVAGKVCERLAAINGATTSSGTGASFTGPCL